MWKCRIQFIIFRVKPADREHAAVLAVGEFTKQVEHPGEYVIRVVFGFKISGELVVVVETMRGGLQNETRCVGHESLVRDLRSFQGGPCQVFHC